MFVNSVVISFSTPITACVLFLVLLIWFLLHSREILLHAFCNKVCVSVCVRASQPGRECVSQLRGAEHSGLTDRLSACLSKGQWELSSSNPPHTTWISHSDSMPLLWIICCQGNFTLTHTRGPSALTVCVYWKSNLMIDGDWCGSSGMKEHTHAYTLPSLCSAPPRLVTINQLIALHFSSLSLRTESLFN